MSTERDPFVGRRLTIGVSIIATLISLPLFALATVLGLATQSHPEPAKSILLTSFPLTFGIFFAVVAWRGFASAHVLGAAISPDGWRYLAAFFTVLGVVVTGLESYCRLVSPSSACSAIRK
jgi:hypothetical protein